jgi:hypothetical protein
VRAFLYTPNNLRTSLDAALKRACQTPLLALKSRKPRKRLDRHERSDIRQDKNEQERATINQTLVQFLQRLVADRSGSQGTRVHLASGDHKVFTNGLPLLYRLLEEHGGSD